MGIEMSLEKIASSALVLLVIDAFAGVTDSDMAIIPSLAGREIIVLANKIDLLNDDERNRALDEIGRATGSGALAFSAKTGEGLDALEREIEQKLSTQYLEFKNFFIADFRMTSLLEKALEAADGVGQCLRERRPPEITGFAVQELIDALMEITGEITPDTVLDSIFSRFCIGK
jgi:tRNA modification GTPase